MLCVFGRDKKKAYRENKRNEAFNYAENKEL